MSGTAETPEKGRSQVARGQSALLPSNLTQKEFGKVYTQRVGNETRVEFTIKMEAGEGYQTGVAIDASHSMMGWFGKMLRAGTIPKEVMADYEQRGWVRDEIRDHRQIKLLTKAAQDDAIKRGFMNYSENLVQMVARDAVAYLAEELDVDGGTTLTYWACGDGSDYEVVGDFTAEQCRALEIVGPQEKKFGTGTRLAPAMRYFVERFADAKQGLYVLITDGRLDDEQEVAAYTRQLAQEIEGKRRNPVKFVIIGVGDKVDKAQLGRLDDLDTGTDEDIWDAKIAGEMRDIRDLVDELVDENRVVAERATIYDAEGNVVKRFTDGMPGKVVFNLPTSSEHFELEVGDLRIRQTVVPPQSS